MINSKITDQIFAALHARDTEKARRIVRDNHGVLEARDTSGISILQMALYMRAEPFVAMLLEEGAVPDLWAAAALGDAGHLATAIRANDGKVSGHSADGWTALHLAAHFGNTDSCRLLLFAGADVSAWSTNSLRNQPLHAAIAGGSDDVVALILEAGADANAAQHGGFTPLHGAAEHGAGVQVTSLLARGADPRRLTDDGQSAIDVAERAGHVELAERLRQLIS
ncbi:MAG: ankyrin repeat domain-containing protein [Proteobacteria bacterium]|nr:ankyrin repeat domain-containing protein [Pseudomonadota bacterium]